RAAGVRLFVTCDIRHFRRCLLLARAVRASVAGPDAPRLRIGAAFAQVRSSWIGLVLVSGAGSSPRGLRAPAPLLQARPSFRQVAVMFAQGLGQVPGSGGLTSRSSRNRFVTQTTWQVNLAMCFAPLRVSA